MTQKAKGAWRLERRSKPEEPRDPLGPLLPELARGDEASKRASQGGAFAFAESQPTLLRVEARRAARSLRLHKSFARRVEASQVG